jgi:hypothetical protein
MMSFIMQVERFPLVKHSVHIVTEMSISSKQLHLDLQSKTQKLFHKPILWYNMTIITYQPIHTCIILQDISMWFAHDDDVADGRMM